MIGKMVMSNRIGQIWDISYTINTCHILVVVLIIKSEISQLYTKHTMLVLDVYSRKQISHISIDEGDYIDLFEHLDTWNNNRNSMIRIS